MLDTFVSDPEAVGQDRNIYTCNDVLPGIHKKSQLPPIMHILHTSIAECWAEKGLMGAEA